MSVEWNGRPLFAQDEIADMARAVDDVCEALEIPLEDSAAIKLVAARVLNYAQRGERDPAVLAQRVISETRPSAA